MSSATKTLELLAFFSPAHPEIGLSQMCKLAGRDKATTYRHLQTLEDAGLVEQNRATKHYRLGPALLQLAELRELTVPRASAASTALEALVEATGETAHVSTLSGNTLYPLISRASQLHSTRAIIDVKTFPLHATASGLCAVAFGPDGLTEAAIAKFDAFTTNTITTAKALQAELRSIRDTGIARSNQSFENDIHSLSTPLFDASQSFAGAVSVACVASRFTPALEQTIKDNLITASRDITRNWGGTVPATLEAAWAKTQAQPLALDTAS